MNLRALYKTSSYSWIASTRDVEFFVVHFIQESDEKKDTSGNDDRSCTSETNSEPQENSDDEPMNISGRKRTTSTPGSLLSNSDENSLDQTVHCKISKKY